MIERILVVGLGREGLLNLPPKILERIARADLLVGGKRHLGYFPDFTGSTLAITNDVIPVVKRLGRALEIGEQAVVLASGDPLYYGIGATLRRFFPAGVLEVIPSPTAFQLAFAALSEPWHDALLLSAHARPLEDVVQGILHLMYSLSSAHQVLFSKVAILTDGSNTPAVIARSLLSAGFPIDTNCAVCENLGGLDQRIVHASLARVAHESYAPLNVFVVWRNEEHKLSDGHEPSENNTETGPNQQASSLIASETIPYQLLPSSYTPPGLPDEAFATSGGLITKRGVRLLSLAELALRPGEVMWDIGAGSASVSIEAARSQPTATIYVVEKSGIMCEYIRENLRRFPAPNLHMTIGMAPDACLTWPYPDAVFVGGSGGRLPEIIELVRQRLRPNGRLVINLVTLENLHIVRMLLPEAQVSQVCVHKGTTVQTKLRFEAVNPVFIAIWRQAPNG